jgi:hypothetical protein
LEHFGFRFLDLGCPTSKVNANMPKIENSKTFETLSSGVKHFRQEIFKLYKVKDWWSGSSGRVPGGPETNPTTAKKKKKKKKKNKIKK